MEIGMTDREGRKIPELVQTGGSPVPVSQGQVEKGVRRGKRGFNRPANQSGRAGLPRALGKARREIRGQLDHGQASNPGIDLREFHEVLPAAGAEFEMRPYAGCIAMAQLTVMVGGNVLSNFVAIH
jgi:hypothetical protein